MKNHAIVFLKILLLCFVLFACNLCAGRDVSASNMPTVLGGSSVGQPESDSLPKEKDLAPVLSASQQSTADDTGAAQVASTNGPAIAPDPGYLPTPGVVDLTATNESKVNLLLSFQTQLDLARKERHDKSPALAAVTLITLLETNSPAELKRQALFELALANQDQGQLLRAQQIFAQYLNRYQDDPSTPEVLLRQGMIYREMGVTSLAISKFYAVMSTALKLKLDYMDYYKKLVLQAQVEIADTYYLEGKNLEASDFFARLLKTDAAGLNKPQVHYKLIRSLSTLTNHADTIAKAQLFLDLYTNSLDVPEVRFLLASALKNVGRNQEAMKQVLMLLQSQEENAKKNPETWIYWQQRAGNEIANQLYKEGDYLNALEIYINLADLNKTLAWQLPVWYQTGLVYEQLQQWPKATEIYDRIISHEKDLADLNASPSLVSLFDMARWRKDYIAWVEKSKVTNLTFQRTRSEQQPAGAVQQ